MVLKQSQEIERNISDKIPVFSSIVFFYSALCPILSGTPCMPNAYVTTIYTYFTFYK